MSRSIMPRITLWPKCSECAVPYVLRRFFQFTTSKHVWLWQPDCKHKKAEAIIVDERKPKVTP